MHVVQALVSLNLGGSELVAVELAEYAVAHGHQATVIAADGPLGERLRESGARHLDWSIGRKRLGTLAYILKLREWLRQEQPDVLHVHSRLPGWICRLALRGLDSRHRPALVTSMHGHYSISRYSAVMASGERVIAVSDRIREYTLHNYPGVDPERLLTVHGGVSLDAFPFGHKPPATWYESTWRQFPELKGRRIICLPGRLSRYKGHAAFIELVARLVPDQPEIHGIVVGEAKPGSRYRDELEGLAERFGVLDRITFTGARMDIREWMAASEIVYSLCADPPEAFGRTIPEALHLGVPAIGWNHGGVKETLSGMFPQGAVAPGDHQELLSRSLAFLHRRPIVRQSSAFSLAESMRKTLDVYQNLLSEKAS